MPDVLLNTLAVKNFGPFYGETILRLSPMEDRSGILIGGRNGAGKTHLLRAIYLAVVGEIGTHDLADLERERPSERSFRFDQSLNRKARAEGETVAELSVGITKRDPHGGAPEEWMILRTIAHRPNSPPRWQSTLFKPNGSKIDDDDEIQRIRDGLLPRHLARFFFFDAERSHSLHLGGEDIVKGVSRVLGLWTYEELVSDLRSLCTNKIPQQFGTRAYADNEKKLCDLSAEVQRTEGYINTELERTREIETEIRAMETELAEVEEERRGLGTADPEELARTKQRREQIKSAKEEIESQLQACWELDLPLALMGTYRQDLREYLVREERRRDWQRSRDAVEPRIPQVKAEVFGEAPADCALSEPVREFYCVRLDKALRSIFHPPPEGMAESVFVAESTDVSAQVRHILNQGTPKLDGLAARLEQIERHTAELRELDSALRRGERDQEALTHSGELRERSRNLHNHLEAARESVRESLAEQQKLEVRLGDFRRQEENQRKAVEKAQKGKTLTSLAATYREVAEEVQSKAAIELRSKIGEQVGELWVEIADRKHEFLGMEFDDHWNCWLVRQDGKRVSWEEVNTSAGQQQVRMLAFYEALRRLAHLVPPLVVDTPLGRLDKEVREAVLERIYLSGHQSIMLATNSEVDPEGALFGSIRRQLARVYTLEAHGEEGSPDYTVTVRSDYFGRSI